ncbi:hypothetical protein HF086_008997 [Spodoptera exigua]|uniref:Serine-threonine/tyrosine-protein kinase catalytic domain-containing protein n=1 Tax=Spodoptera exigua TaxID=7107 RepID=A0A922MNG0_SPOEX|nr:hypothetical protein HF086_008997 [Spodoptera exigua]
MRYFIYKTPFSFTWICSPNWSWVRHENIVRLLGLCNEADPHYMLLEHTDWGELKKFLIATRSPEENAEYVSRVGAAHAPPAPSRACPPLGAQHRALLAAALAAALAKMNFLENITFRRPRTKSDSMLTDENELHTTNKTNETITSLPELSDDDDDEIKKLKEQVLNLTLELQNAQSEIKSLSIENNRPQFTEIYEEITTILQDITSETTSQKSQDKAEE